MKRRIMISLTIAVLCLGLLASCSTSTISSIAQPPPDSSDRPAISGDNTTTGNKVGDNAPNFELPLHDGDSVALNDLRGKPVLLNFFATWCGPCMAEMPDIHKIHEEYGDKVHVLCVDVGETSDIVEEFLTEGGYSFPVALDLENITSEPYGLTGIPQTYVLNSDGIITWHQLGTSDYKAFAAQLDALL